MVTPQAQTGRFFLLEGLFDDVLPHQEESVVTALKALTRASAEEKKEFLVFPIEVDGKQEMVTNSEKVAEAYNPNKVEEIVINWRANSSSSFLF